MTICDYGCGQEAKYLFKNGKWCCSESQNSCPKIRNKKIGKKRSKKFKKDHSKFMKNKWKDIQFRKKNLKELKKSWSDERKEETSERMKKVWFKKRHIYMNESRMAKFRISHHFTSLINLEKKYKLFFKIEEYLFENEQIKVRCKYNKCKNSKEKDGWFIPTYSQLYERIRAIENPSGYEENNFYCSEECKMNCDIFMKRSDPFKSTEKPYTQAEYNTWRLKVLRRQKEEYSYNHCEKCESIEKLHVHHEKPVKTHPHLALDPDNGIVLCQDCHSKYGHKAGSECSTGVLANKFLPGCKLGGQE